MMERRMRMKRKQDQKQIKKRLLFQGFL